MKQDEKDLLLKDLCGRLPYKTKIQLTEYSDLTGEKLPSKIKILDYCMLGRVQAYCKGFRKDEVKPYLFPLSSMTEEQLLELKERYYIDSYYFSIISCTKIRYHKTWHSDTDTECSLQDYLWLIDWLNRNHFDYMGLIEKGLALDATGLNIY